MAHFKLGQKVRTARRRWIRSGETGTVRAYESDGDRMNHWLVEFSPATFSPGRGIMVEGIEGQCLWLDEDQLTAIE